MLLECQTLPPTKWPSFPTPILSLLIGYGICQDKEWIKKYLSTVHISKCYVIDCHRSCVPHYLWRSSWHPWEFLALEKDISGETPGPLWNSSCAQGDNNTQKELDFPTQGSLCPNSIVRIIPILRMGVFDYPFSLGQTESQWSLTKSFCIESATSSTKKVSALVFTCPWGLRGFLRLNELPEIGTNVNIHFRMFNFLVWFLFLKFLPAKGIEH